MTKEQNKNIIKFAKKIQPIYELLNWKWVNKRVTIEGIHSTILELLNDLEKDKEYRRCSTGGLYAERINEVDNSYIIYGFNSYNFLE